MYKKCFISTCLALLLGCSWLIGVASCQDTVGQELSNPTATIGEETVDFTSTAGHHNVTVLTDFDGWKATTDQSWLTAIPQGKSVFLSVEASEEITTREAVVTLTMGSLTRTIKVRQLGVEPTILVVQTLYNIPAPGQRIELVVTSNVAVDLKLPAWISKVEDAEARAMALTSSIFHLEVEPNTSPESRSGTIEVVEQMALEGRTVRPVSVGVNQQASDTYQATRPEGLTEDVKLQVVSGTDSSHQGADDITKAFDGDMSTLWHSAWANSGQNYFPITATLNFAETQEVDYFIYYPRTSGYNGHWKEVDIEYSLDGTTFTPLVRKDFGGVGTPTRVSFDRSIQAKSFRFIIRSGHGDGQGFASATEIEFYQRNRLAFDYRKFFTDETCSELLPGTTEEQIREIKELFYKNLAYHLKLNRYAREFRIAEYQPYPHPDIQARDAKRWEYSLLDNPTGIYVEAEETLVVFVGDTHGFDNLSLRVVNLDKPNGDGFGDASTYPLTRGINKLRMDRRGLVYVMYHSNSLDTSNLRPIKIHFASGTVNGYFDSQNPAHEGRFSELLGKAKGKYFDVLGQYAHLTFPVSRFLQHTAGQGKELIDMYDKVVHNEWILHGYYKYNRVPKNRMYLHVMYHSYMYATSYHTAYNDETLPTILTPQSLENNIWGPAHELGHVNQTHGLKWKGMTECTVNIPSAYVQTYIFGKPCRLQVENMEENNPHNRYTKAWNEYFVPTSPIPHSQSRDVFCKLVPFWQLELYLGKAKGNTPTKRKDHGGFYPDVYEYLRQADNQNWSNGKQQAEFAYVASLKSGYNLTRFFERWGFLVPVDVEIDDYGSARMTITQSMADDVRRRIAALNLPEPDGAIEYITDNTADLYRNYPAVVAGSVTREGRKLTFSNWQNVVAYEVYDATGRLIYVSAGILSPAPTATLTIPRDWEDGFVVKVVSAKGERTQVSL